jgi:hypothetical protein
MADRDVDWTRIKAWLARPLIGCCFPEPEAPAQRPDDAEATDTTALREAWRFVQDNLPERWHDAAMQWLQRVRYGHYMRMAEAIIACFEQDELVATPDGQAPAATGSGFAATGRVARFDIDAPGDERIPGEGGPKEFAMRQKHKAERVRQMVLHDAKEMIYGGKYFSQAQQDDWTARTTATADRNLLCDKSGKPIHSPEKTLNFVVVEDAGYQPGNGERLILCPEKTPTGAKYSTHSQLACGGPVKYSGEMWLEMGVIARYNLKAGHYRQPMARKAEKLRDHQLRIADQQVRLESLVDNPSAADTGDDEAYRNSETNRMRLAAIAQEYDSSQERAAKFAQYLAKKLGPYVGTQDPPDIDDDVSTLDLILEDVPRRDAGT